MRKYGKAKEEGRLDEAEALHKTAQEMQRKAAIASSKYALFEFTRSAPPINKNLLDENWVDAAKEQLAKNVDLTKILSSGKSIIDAFYSDFALAMGTKDLVPQAKVGQLGKSLEQEQPQIQNQVPQNGLSVV